MMDVDLLMIQPNELIPDQSNNHFAQCFWGEKNQGFAVLQQNMKHGQTSVKELQDYIRESANVEELYAKQMMKLAKQAASCSQQGTFYPLMEIFRVMNEKVSSCHMDIVLKLHDLIKDLQKYHEDQKSSFKKHKDTFTGTNDSLHNFQAATSSVMKQKEKYYQIKAEEERLIASGVAQKDLDRVATKLKKAAEEYRSNVGKHAIARLQFEEKMYLAANEFQRLEKEHLDHMKAVLDTYILSFENSQVLISQVHQEFRRQLQERTSDVILRKYAEDKGTGTDRPAAITFEEFSSENTYSMPAESIYENIGLGDNTNQNTSVPVPNKTKKEGVGLFGIRRRKGKQKNGASVRSKDAQQAPAEKDDKQNVMVDEEGYTIRPDSPNRSEGTSFKFSSDSDSDDDDVSHRKFDVKIKPKDLSSADDSSNNVEVLTAITKNLNIGSPSMRTNALAPPESKRSRSIRSSPSTSSEKTSPQTMHYSFTEDFGSTYATVESTLGDLPPKSNDTGPIATTTNLLKPGNRKDKRSSIKKGPAPPIPSHETEAKDMSVLLTTRNADSILHTHSEKPPPRPPKPHGIDAEMLTVSSNEQSPKSGPLVYSESWSSLSSAEGSLSTSTNDNQSIPTFASFSRGPSPLTLSAGDSIPIAVAFLETVHAYFKKGGPSNTLTKISGEVQISFPAGIIRAFTSTSNAPILSFKIYSNQSDRLQNLTHNKSVLSSTSSDVGHYEFSFDMPALIKHLKKQVDNNPHCPYYNIHIISYLVPSSHSTLPLYLSCSWNCDSATTHLDIDYIHNSSATTSPLQSVNVIVPVNGSVTSSDSTPKSTWSSSQNRLSWSIPEISITSPSGKLESSLAVASGPSTPSAFAVQFMSEGSTLSGADFQLLGFGYRVSLIKKRFTSGKYLCENLQTT